MRTARFPKAGDHQAVIEFTPRSVENSIAAFSALCLGFRAPLSPTALQDALRVAAEAEYTVVCIGTNGEWETDGVDRWGLTRRASRTNWCGPSGADPGDRVEHREGLFTGYRHVDQNNLAPLFPFGHGTGPSSCARCSPAPRNFSLGMP